MATIGNLIVNVLANTGGFASGMGKARKQLTFYQREVLRAQKATALFTRALGAVGVGFGISRMVGMIRQTTEEISLLVDTSQKLGITTEALGSLRWAGQQTGVEAGTLDAGLQKLTKSISEAAKGTGRAKKELKELGVNVNALNLATPDKQFRAIVGAMQGVENQADKVRIAFKLFGNEGTALLNTIALGSQGLRQMENDAKALGIAIDQKEAEQIEEFGDKLEKLGASWKGLKTQIVIDITPAAAKAVDYLSETFGGARLVARAQGKSVPSAMGEMAWRPFKGQFPWTTRKMSWLWADESARLKRRENALTKWMIQSGIGAESAAPPAAGPDEQAMRQGTKGGALWSKFEHAARMREFERERARINQQVGNWMRGRLTTIGNDAVGTFNRMMPALKSTADAFEKGSDALKQWALRDMFRWLLEPGTAPPGGKPGILAEITGAASFDLLKTAKEMQQATEMVNAPLERGTVAAYQAQRDRRTERLMLEQLRAQKDAAATLDEIAVQLKEDNFDLL